MQKSLTFIANQPGRQKSKAQLIYEALARQEITQAEANNWIAFLVGSSTPEYPAREYPAIGTALDSYISSRINNLVKRDHDLAVKNGEWIQLAHRRACANKHDVETLTWALELCKGLLAREQVRLIEHALARHRDNYFPWSVFERALRVQRMDVEEKLRNATYERKN